MIVEIDDLLEWMHSNNLTHSQGFIAAMTAAVSTVTDKSLEDVQRAVRRYLPQAQFPKRFPEIHKQLFVTFEHEQADRFISDQLRSGTGSYYTSKLPARFMVRKTLATALVNRGVLSYEAFCEAIEKEAPYQWVSASLAKRIQRILQCMTYIDFACGDGIFLRLLREEISRWFPEEKRADLMHVLDAQITGVDLQVFPLQVQVLQRMLMRKCVDLGTETGLVQCNAILGNALLQNPRIQRVLHTGGFDVVIGNPPYIGEKGNQEIFRALREHAFGKQHYAGKMDLSYYFTIRGLELLCPGGLLTYLTTSYFTSADGARKYRRTLWEKARFVDLIPFGTIGLFEDARGQHNMIYQLQKTTANIEATVHIPVSRKNVTEDAAWWDDLFHPNPATKHVRYQVENKAIWTEDQNIILPEREAHMQFLRFLQNRADACMGECFHINQGIVSGLDRISEKKVTKKLGREAVSQLLKDTEEPVFVYNEREVQDYKIEAQWLVPFYKNSDIQAYVVKKRSQWQIAYLTDHHEIADLQETRLYAHLSRFRSLLEMRREVALGRRVWYALQWPREEEIFTGPKIIAPQRRLQNSFAYTSEPFFASADVYYLTSREPIDHMAWLYYTAWLNSTVSYFWLYYMGKRKGELLELYATPLKNIPVVQYDGLEWQQELANLVASFVDETDSCSLSEEDARIRSGLIIGKGLRLSEDMLREVTDFYLSKRYRSEKG